MTDAHEASEDIIDKATKTAEKVVHDARGTAQNLIATAESVAHKLVEEATTEPTNAELMDMFEQHAEADKLVFKEIKDSLKTLPTAEQTEKMNSFLEKLDTGERIFSFGFNNSSKIVGVLVLIGAIWMLFKLGFIGAFAWLTGKNL